MGTLSDIVPVLVDLDVGTFRLQFKHTLEAVLNDDRGVVVP